MAKPDSIELADGTRIPVLYEDRSVLALDKPAGWMLAPVHWRNTGRNLQAALESSVAEGAWWARSRHLRFLRHVHRLDAETSGVLLLARSRGALSALSALFESREVGKLYLAVVRGFPARPEWVCRLPLGEAAGHPVRSRVDRQDGRPAETGFRVRATAQVPRRGPLALVECRPLTGRTHQIRIHLAESGHPVVGDALYGDPACTEPLALRAVALTYRDPFSGRAVQITAPEEEFLRSCGLAAAGRSPSLPGSSAAWRSPRSA